MEDLLCPGCAHPMEEMSREPTLSGCTSCGSLWVDAAMLEAVKADTVAKEARLFIAQIETKASQQNGAERLGGYRDGPHQRTCPTCAEILKAKSPFGTKLEIDVCEAHGVFLDRREFQAYETAIVVHGALLEERQRGAKGLGVFAEIAKKNS